MLASTPSPSAVAEVRVGPRDGMVVESLPPVAMPIFQNEQKLPNTALAKRLERQENWAMAAMEWQRLALETSGKEEATAWMHAALATAKTGSPHAAADILSTVLETAPATQHDELMFHFTRFSTGVSQTEALAQLAQNPANPWAKAALWQNVMQQARTGAVTKTYNLPEAESLRRTQAAFAQKSATMALTTGLIGLVPGAGHMVLGHYTQGAMILLFTALFALAFLSACRHRHYAYAFLLVIPAASLWLNSPILAYQATKAASQATWQAQLAAWENKIPTPAEGFTLLPEPSVPEALPPLVPQAASPTVASISQALIASPSLAVPVLKAVVQQVVSSTLHPPVSPPRPHALSVPVGASRPPMQPSR